MATFASTTPAAATDGVVYSSSFSVPTTNADNDLFNGVGPDPVPLPYECAVVAEVQLVLGGTIGANAGSYVVLQTDLGDGNWYDVAWCQTVSTTAGTLNFLLSGGVAGANAIQQTRAAGAAPASNGSNQIPLGGRIRFVGRNQLSGGAAPTLTANIRYKLLGLR